MVRGFGTLIAHGRRLSVLPLPIFDQYFEDGLPRLFPKVLSDKSLLAVISAKDKLLGRANHHPVHRGNPIHRIIRFDPTLRHRVATRQAIAVLQQETRETKMPLDQLVNSHWETAYNPVKCRNETTNLGVRSSNLFGRAISV
jgi:hypothetical protein